MPGLPMLCVCHTILLIRSRILYIILLASIMHTYSGASGPGGRDALGASTPPEKNREGGGIPEADYIIIIIIIRTLAFVC